MNHLKYIFLSGLIFLSPQLSRAAEITCLFTGGADNTNLITFQPVEGGFESHNSFVTLTSELTGIIPELTVAGDFTGDRINEVSF